MHDQYNADDLMRLRVALKWTRPDAAKEYGVSVGAWKRWENEHYTSRSKVITLLARFICDDMERRLKASKKIGYLERKQNALEAQAAARRRIDQSARLQVEGANGIGGTG
jgi:DNA-binding XRE family transcriptional regulator